MSAQPLRSAATRICRVAVITTLVKPRRAFNTLASNMAGVAGFEPANAGIKTRCLTAWRHPNPARLTRCIGLPNRSFVHARAPQPCLRPACCMRGVPPRAPQLKAPGPAALVDHGSGAYCMAVPRCVNALDGFMVWTLKGTSPRGTPPCESSVEYRRRSGGRAIQRNSAAMRQPPTDEIASSRVPCTAMILSNPLIRKTSSICSDSEHRANPALR